MEDDYSRADSPHSQLRPCANSFIASIPSFDGRDGLPQSQVRALLEDQEGSMWVAQTDAGLAQVFAEAPFADVSVVSLNRDLDSQGRFVRLNQGLGLLSDETNQASVRLDAAGRLWFGMTKGVCILDTREPLRLPELPVPAVLEVHWPGSKDYLPHRLRPARLASA